MFFSIILSLIFFSTSSMVPQENDLWIQIAPELIERTIILTGSPQNPLTRYMICAVNALAEHGQNYPSMPTEMHQTFTSLHMFDNVIPRIACTNLMMGYWALAKNICLVSHDMSQLSFTHAINQQLQQRSDLVHLLIEQLKPLKRTEQIFLAHFFPKSDDSQDEASDSKIERLVKNIYKAQDAAQRMIHGNQYVSSFDRLSSQYSVLHQDATIIANAASGAATAAYRVSAAIKAAPIVAAAIAKAAASPGGALQSATSQLSEVTPAQIALVAGIGLWGLWKTYGAINTGIDWLRYTEGMNTRMLKDRDTILQWQTFLINLNAALAASKKIHDEIAAHPNLAILLPGIQNTLNYFGNLKQSKEIHQDPKLTAFLASMDSYLFSDYANKERSWLQWSKDVVRLTTTQGTITSVYTKFLDVKQHFVKLWQALGELDAYLSVQQLLMQQYGTYCQPTWVTTNSPSLQLIDYWHPGLPAQKAVQNSIELGKGTNRNNPRNVVITGANAGGKTTAMTAIMIAQLMAQSLGIAPAAQLVATPFARFHTYLDITTNLKEGKSLFVAQADRAKKVYESILASSTSEKSLTILDEIFTGTGAEHASQDSFDFANRLGKMPYSICILATHFPQLTQLEKTGEYMNMKVEDATIAEDGTINYPYKIVPGISTQNIARHILKQRGLVVEESLPAGAVPGSLAGSAAPAAAASKSALSIAQPAQKNTRRGRVKTR